MLEQKKDSFVVPNTEWLALYGLARTVLTLAHENYDKRLTYSDLWKFSRGEPAPRGQWWLRVLSTPLNNLACACVNLQLPYLNALIVRKGPLREPSLAAINNMWKFAQANGIATGGDPRQFALMQGEAAAALSLRRLDEAFGQTTI